LDATLSVTVDASKSSAPFDPVPEIHEYRENTQGAYLTEVHLVVEPDLVFGEPLEETKPLWRQRVVQRLAFFIFLLVVGLVVGVVVAVGGGDGVGSAPEPPNFNCSNLTVG
jgi:hypothetical protein